MERVMKRKERKKRKRNLVFKRVKRQKGDTKEGVVKICMEIGVEIKIEKIRRKGENDDSKCEGQGEQKKGFGEQKRVKRKGCVGEGH